MARKGLFIVFEGISDCGKHTQAALAAKYFHDESKGNDNVLLTREPTNGPYGRRIRELLKKRTNPYSAAEEFLRLYVRDREWHVKNTIKPALAKGYVVISDRFKHSTISYQHAQGVPLNRAVKANAKFPAPDLTIILDVSPEESLRRVHKQEGRNYKETFDKLAFLKKAREIYLALPKLLRKEKIAAINGQGTPAQVFKRVKPRLDKLRRTS